MNNIDLILDSIKEDAKKEADNILSSAKKEAEENLEKRKKEAEKEAEKILSSADHESKLLIENSKTTANREARDIKIRAQNEVVAEVLEELKERLKALSDEKYKKYVLNSLKNMKLENGEILLQKDKINSLTKEELNNLKISKDTVDEGFVVRSGKIEYDSKFSSIVDYNKDIYEKIIVEEIFK
jgi:V/A-type H+-transporting ATPase subunit E